MKKEYDKMGNTKNICITINAKDLKSIDDYCTVHSMTRSKFLLQSALEKVWTENIADGLLLLNQYFSRANSKEFLEKEDRELLEKAAALLKGVQGV